MTPTTTSRHVDSFKLLDFFTRTILKAWIERERYGSIPWTPLTKPLNESTVAMVSTAAIALKEDQPFDQDGERRNPWWGDPSYRLLPRDATEKDVTFYHLHATSRYAAQDINCVLPLRRLLELEQKGEIGRSAPTHYSFMGYLLEPQALLRDSVPAIIEGMKAEQVDVALLVPF